MTAAVAAFQDPTLKFGTQKDSAACVFPARKRVLESLLGKSFPSPACPELETWVSRIGADQASLVFVGAYPGNPASVLGHSFLRLSNRARESSGREGLDLLSYSIGFTAQADPRDNRMIYMLKGLTGGYAGYYEIEPHYMKIGLYNNSESRDLWDMPLELTPSEVDMMVRHYWELTFNASLDYYFIDENCSYRLLTLIEAVKPDVDLTSKLSMVVLPAETVRTAIEADLAKERPRFRPSVKRRMNYKLRLLDDSGRIEFDRARRSLEATRELSDPTAADALLDYWLYENYKVKTDLDDRSKALMEATYSRTAELRSTSRFHGVTNERIRDEAELSPPFEGHEPSWLELRAGATTRGHFGALTYRNGAHPFWSGDRGYDDISGIEYLGVDLEAAATEKARWSLLLAKATAYENFFSFARDLSWSFEGKLTNACSICRTDASVADVEGGVGVGAKTSNFTAYLLAHVKAAAWSENGTQGLVAPGFASGLKSRHGRLTMSIEARTHWWKDANETRVDARVTRSLGLSRSLLVHANHEDLNEANYRSSLSLGFAQFF